MFKFFKSILTSLVIAVCICCNNNVFADTYIVDVAVVGSIRAGKSSLIERMVKGTFTPSIKPTNWPSGAKSWDMYQRVGHDVFIFRFWDAPGYTGDEHAKEVEKIISKSGMFESAKIAVIVTDMSRREGLAGSQGSDVDVLGYIHDIRKVKKTCKIIVVGTHTDLIDEKNKVKFKGSLEALCTRVYGECPCFAISSKEDKDLGLRGFMEYLISTAKQIDPNSFEKEKHCSGQGVECCKCRGSGILYPIEECVPWRTSNGDVEYYCPEHKRLVLPRRCPGVTHKDEYYFVEKDEKFAVASDGTEFCSRECMVETLSQPCPCCHKIVSYADHENETRRGKYCSKDCRRKAEGTLCPMCQVKKFLSDEGKKVGNTEVCDECIRKVVWCQCPGCDRPIIRNPFGKSNGKKYCSRDHFRADDGISCPGCQTRFLEDDPGVCRGPKHGLFHSKACAEKLDGHVCDAGSNCKHYNAHSGPAKHLIVEMRQGAQDEEKYYCDEHCRIVIEGPRCAREQCQYHSIGFEGPVVKGDKGKKYCSEACKKSDSCIIM